MVESAAARVVADLPADQALGLRLIMLARAAAGVHMAACAEDASRGSAGTAERARRMSGGGEA